MYCKVCGCLLDDTDRFCKACGTKTDFQPPAESSEKIEKKKDVEVVFNPPFEESIHHNRFYFVEDKSDADREEEREELQEFLSEDKIQGQTHQEDVGDDVSKKSHTEFQWNVHDFPKTKKTEDAVFNWKLEELNQTDKKEIVAEIFEEELFREIKAESDRAKESNMDRFFTFSKKNEEFQELLDREYERFNRQTLLESGSDAPAVSSASGQDENVLGEDASTGTKVCLNHEAMPYQEEAFDGVGLSDQKETLDQQQKELDKDSEESEMAGPQTAFDWAIGAAEEGPEEQKASDHEDKEPDYKDNEPDHEDMKSDHELENRSDHLAEMAKARSEFFTDGLIKDNEDILKKMETPDPEEDQSMKPETVFALESDVSEYDEGLPADLLSGFQGIEKEPQEEAPKEEEPQEEAAVLMGSEYEVEDGRGRNRAAQIVLIIIAVVLVLEIGILAIRYFAPDSAAAKTINEAQAKIVYTVTGWFDGIKDQDSGNASNEGTDADMENIDENAEQPSDNGSDITEPDPAPMTDKNALVASQLDKNTNIQWVGNNNELKFEEGKDYGLADLNNSKTIENNIWMQKDEETVYYDQSVVGTIIAFDSQWIDYVNGGSDNVLSLLKKGSTAYKNAVNFSKIGKVEETFNVLQIGEIRQGSNGFYVWAHEEIQITEKGTLTEKKYNWIYYLEPVEGKMNIVNYFKF